MTITAPLPNEAEIAQARRLLEEHPSGCLPAPLARTMPQPLVLAWNRLLGVAAAVSRPPQ